MPEQEGVSERGPGALFDFSLHLFLLPEHISVSEYHLIRFLSCMETAGVTQGGLEGLCNPSSFADAYIAFGWLASALRSSWWCSFAVLFGNQN